MCYIRAVKYIAMKMNKQVFYINMNFTNTTTSTTKTQNKQKAKGKRSKVTYGRTQQILFIESPEIGKMKLNCVEMYT